MKPKKYRMPFIINRLRRYKNNNIILKNRLLRIGVIPKTFISYNFRNNTA